MSNCELCILRELNSIKSLSKEEINKFSDHKDTIDFKKGDVLFSEGNILNGVYCIKEGICKMSRLSENGKEQIVKFIKKGDMLGYRSVLSEEPVTLTATALKDLKTCYIPKSTVFEAMKTNPKFSMEMTKTVCNDLRDANMIITNMAQKHVKERLADTLVFLNDTFGIDTEGYLDILLTREELSSVIGTATESAIRLLSEFKRKRLIELSGKKIKIIDAQGLHNISQGF